MYRIGNLTLGDFWGFDSSKGEFPVPTNYGLSLVMGNTEKGLLLLQSCQEEMVLQQRELPDAIHGNLQLLRPAKRHANQRVFRKRYQKYGFERAAKSVLWKERIGCTLVDFFVK